MRTGVVGNMETEGDFRSHRSGFGKVEVGLGAKRPHKHMDPRSHGMASGIRSFSWAFEPECRILMFIPLYHTIPSYNILVYHTLLYHTRIYHTIWILCLLGFLRLSGLES